MPASSGHRCRPEEAAVIAEIGTAVLDGLSLGQIAAYLRGRDLEGLSIGYRRQILRAMADVVILPTQTRGGSFDPASTQITWKAQPDCTGIARSLHDGATAQ